MGPNLKATPPTQADEAEASDIVCPFCREGAFDLIGLKMHIERHWCDAYEELDTDETEGEVSITREELQRVFSKCEAGAETVLSPRMAVEIRNLASRALEIEYLPTPPALPDEAGEMVRRLREEAGVWKYRTDAKRLIHGGELMDEAADLIERLAPRWINNHAWPAKCVDVTDTEAIRWYFPGGYKWTRIFPPQKGST